MNFLTLFSVYALLLSILPLDLANSRKKELLKIVYKYIPANYFAKLVGNFEVYDDVAKEEDKITTKVTVGAGALLYADHKRVEWARETEHQHQMEEYRTPIKSGANPAAATTIFTRPSASEVRLSGAERMGHAVGYSRGLMSAGSGEPSGIPSVEAPYQCPCETPSRPTYYPSSTSIEPVQSSSSISSSASKSTGGSK